MTTTDLTKLSDAELAAEIRARHKALYDAVGEAEGRGLYVGLETREHCEVGGTYVRYFTDAKIERYTIEKL
jgi:hypothetical protein